MSEIIKCSKRLFKDYSVFMRNFKDHTTSRFFRNYLGMINLALGYEWFNRIFGVLFNQIFNDIGKVMRKKKMEELPETLG